VTALFVVAAFSSGCIGTGPFDLPKTPVYANWKAPMDLNVNKTTLGSKVGTAKCKAILSLFTSGSCSVAEAARNAGITTINHVEYEYENIGFFMYQVITVTVYGD
jgi:hypothetical protein